MHIKTILNRIERGRTEELNGESYTVYPVIMLTVGVHSGSGGPTLYTEEELQNFSQTWNGVPVTLQHPESNGNPVSANSPEIYESQVLGTVFNVQYSDGKLKAEIWLNNNDLETLDPDLKGRLLSGEKLEVSTGLYSEEDTTAGTFNNEEYTSIARNIRPDHLALLPGEIGACSWEDGCGVRSNKKGGDMIRRKKTSKNEKKWDEFFVNSEESFTINELDYTKIVDLLSSKIDSMDVRGEKINYLSRVFSDHVIYRIHYRDSETPNRMVKRNYRIENDAVVWTSEPINVMEQVTYTEIHNNIETKTNEKEKGMEKEKVKTMRECCPDKVNELISNNANFTEENRESLLDMTEDGFALTINVAKDVDSTEENDLTENAEKEETQENVEVNTMDDLLANAAPELRESIEYGQKILSEKKAKLIDTIKANKGNSFSDEELSGFKMDFLEKLVKMAPAPKANYALNQGSSFAEDKDIEPLPISNSWGDEE